MATKYTDEFRRDAVRIAATSGLTRPQAASDLGVGLSTLNKWVQKHHHDASILDRAPLAITKRAPGVSIKITWGAVGKFAQLRADIFGYHRYVAWRWDVSHPYLNGQPESVGG